MDGKKTIHIVLVRPKDDGNIGAVCRAMRTMGLTALTIVGKSRFNENAVQTLALRAFDIFKAAELLPDIPTAVADSVLSAGVTRRQGKRRKFISYTPEMLAAKIHNIAQGRVSLVFGNEQHGLTDSELACCDMAVTIPSSASFPSLNLSHAVQIIGYVLFTANLSGETALPTQGGPPADRQQIEAFTASITDSLQKIGFFSFSGAEGKKELSVFFKDILSRALISPIEGKRCMEIFQKIEGLTKKSR